MWHKGKCNTLVGLKNGNWYSKTCGFLPTLFYDSVIHRESLCLGKFPRYCLLGASWEAKWGKPCFLLALLPCPVLHHLSLAKSLHDLWWDQADQNENLLRKKQQVFLNLDLVPAFPQVNLFHSQTVCQRDREDSVPLDFILSPISTPAMGKDPMTAGNSFTCFLITWLRELQSRKDNLYCETHNERLEFITAGLLIYTRLCKIQTRLYSETLPINAHQQVQQRF